MKLTRQKLLWFEQMWEEIEKRATLCTDYIGRVKIPSVHNEHLSSLEVGNGRFRGDTVVKKYIRGEDNYLTFPTDCLYSDEALVRYREEKESGAQRRVQQEQDAKIQEELRLLKKLKEKYPNG